MLEAYLGGITLKTAEDKLEAEIAEHAHALKREERAVLDLLQQSLLLQKAS